MEQNRALIRDTPSKIPIQQWANLEDKWEYGGLCSACDNCIFLSRMACLFFPPCRKHCFQRVETSMQQNRAIPMYQKCVLFLKLLNVEWSLIHRADDLRMPLQTLLSHPFLFYFVSRDNNAHKTWLTSWLSSTFCFRQANWLQRRAGTAPSRYLLSL